MMVVLVFVDIVDLEDGMKEEVVVGGGGKKEEEQVEIDNTTIDMKAEELFRTSFSFLISPYYSKITLNIC